MTGLTAAELHALRRAVELADRGAGTVLPNPIVGCVLLGPDGATVGEGFHERAGGPHAEIVALRAADVRARGATAVVTLEPCMHSGRTGPCTEALIAAGVRRVVVAVRDPWPGAAGGAERLVQAGVDVVLLPDVAGPEAREAVDIAEEGNRVFLTATRLRRPYVTWKAGMTADGRVAAPDGTSRWITSVPARADVHRLRQRVDTMLVGVGTVLTDDPQLTARDPQDRPAARQPLRVVADTHGRTPSTARVRDGTAETWIATDRDVPTAPSGRLDPAALVAALYDRGRRHVLLEGGPTLATSFLDAGLVDEAILYVAPLILGAGQPALDGGAVSTLADAHRAELKAVDRVGPDVRLRYRIRRPDESGTRGARET